MRSFKATDTGKVREINEDYIYSCDGPIGPLDSLYLLADGMGGHAAGEIASRYAVEQFAEHIAQSRSDSAVAALNEAVGYVNSLVRSKAFNTLYEGMGTTLVAASVSGASLYVANVGDSRLYHYSNRLRQVTKDHSWVEEMVSLGRLERDSKDYFLKKNVITRAIGVADKVTADLFEVELSGGDIILMCSDGLTNMVSDAEIAEVLGLQMPLEGKCDLLVRMALDAGGKDNISVILIDPEVEP